MRKTLSFILFLLFVPTAWVSAADAPLPNTKEPVIPLPQDKFLEESDPVQPEEVPVPDAQFLEDQDLKSPNVNKIPLPEEKYREEGDLQYIVKPDFTKPKPKPKEPEKSEWDLWSIPDAAGGKGEVVEEEPPDLTPQLSGREISIEFAAGYAGFWVGALTGFAGGLIAGEGVKLVSDDKVKRDKTVRLFAVTGAIIGTVESVNLLGADHNKEVSRGITATGTLLPIVLLPLVGNSVFTFTFDQPDLYYTLLVPLSATIAYNLGWKYQDSLPEWLKPKNSRNEQVSLLIGKQNETLVLGFEKTF